MNNKKSFKKKTKSCKGSDFTLDEILNLVDDWKDSGGQYSLLCPAHNDHRHSLSIKEAKDGIVLLHCHAGCSFPKVIKAFESRRKKRTRPQLESPNAKVQIYKYHDHRGKLLYRKHRTPNKDFFFDHKNKTGEWTNGMGGAESVLYCLPKVLKAIKENKTVFFVEGEKDVHSLERLGLVATTSGSASSWKTTFVKDLKHIEKAILIPDNDEAGRNYSKKIAKDLFELTESIKILNLPNLKEKEDVSDWLQQGGTKEELLRLAEAAPLYNPTSPEGSEYQLTDLGNAKRLISMFSETIRYCKPWRSWLSWNSKFWVVDAEAHLYSLADETIKSMCNEAAQLSDSRDREKLMKHALNTESKIRIDAMIGLVSKSTQIAITPQELDNNPWSLNLENGTLNLQTGKLEDHQKLDFLTKTLSTKYDPDADYPLWKDFLNKVTNNDKDLMRYLQKICGYVLTGRVSEQKIFFCFGPGGNGKSTFLNVLQDILEDYAFKTSAEFLLRKPSGSHTTDLTDLKGRRLVVTIETQEGRRMAEALVKEITGGDKITARRMRQDNMQWSPTHKVILAANHKPEITDTTLAFWRRVAVIPFEVIISEREKIKDFHEMLLEKERSGILNWMIEGCLLWQKEGLKEPSIVRQASNEYKQEMDILENFINEQCLCKKTSEIGRTELYEKYKLWCRWNEHIPLKSKSFNNKLREKGFRDPDNFFVNGKLGWQGITLKSTKPKVKKRIKRSES